MAIELSSSGMHHGKTNQKWYEQSILVVDIGRYKPACAMTGSRCLNALSEVGRGKPVLVMTRRAGHGGSADRNTNRHGEVYTHVKHGREAGITVAGRSSPVDHWVLSLSSGAHMLRG